MVFGLRPITPRRVIIFTSASLLFWILLIVLTPITSPLPPYTGPHEVGILDVETAVQKRVIHDAVLKETGEDAFELSTLAITLYYPSSLSKAPQNKRPWARPWLPQPISLIGTGYARLAGISFAPIQSLFTFGLWLLGSSTVIPGVVDAPILTADEKILADKSGLKFGSEDVFVADDQVHLELKRDEETGKLPCVVFTHGMAGMSQSYSHYLGSIASHGYVVAAVEHRDGSGPGTIVHHPDGTEKKVWHMKLEDLDSKPPMTDLDLKKAQLSFREAEISETVRLFAQLNDGDAPVVNLKPDSPRKSLPGFKNRLDLRAVTVAGHSYGATGVMQALKAAGSKDMPINGGIALDPGKGSGPLNRDIHVPILVMQSGEWTEKQVEFYDQGKHFGVVRSITQSIKEGWFMTLTGTAHPSCTDAPLIVPWIMKLVTGTTLNPQVALLNYIETSVYFLKYLQTGEKNGVLDSEVTSKDGPLGDAEKRGRVKRLYNAEWEVHVTP
ncbi:platelet-activating factor acetylhydrolase, isoform II-domain-containing protein [Phaeosphaeria sp. MPI-PUGE-AT-0046c]|nr:platelet-activating factor acetylhydrolase, isoform II-domain-containing protein [Phaeosphaeria sp. MPI-PUGE-AT-0046c]